MADLTRRGTLEITDLDRFCTFIAEHPGHERRSFVSNGPSTWSCCGADVDTSWGCHVCVVPHSTVRNDPVRARLLASRAGPPPPPPVERKPQLMRCRYCDMMFDATREPRVGGIEELDRSRHGGPMAIRNPGEFCEYVLEHPGVERAVRLTSTRSFRYHTCCNKEVGTSWGCRCIVVQHSAALQDRKRMMEQPRRAPSAGAAPPAGSTPSPVARKRKARESDNPLFAVNRIVWGLIEAYSVRWSGGGDSDHARLHTRLDEFSRYSGNSITLVVVPATGDGNCLFRALSRQLCGDESASTRIRAACCDQLEQNFGYYRGELHYKDDKALRDYIAKMRNDREYGDTDCLRAFADFTQLRLTVMLGYPHAATSTFIPDASHGFKGIGYPDIISLAKSKDMVCLVHIGNHYDSLFYRNQLDA